MTQNQEELEANASGSGILVLSDELNHRSIVEGRVFRESPPKKVFRHWCSRAFPSIFPPHKLQACASPAQPCEPLPTTR